MRRLSPTVQPTCTAAAGRQRHNICQRDSGATLTSSSSASSASSSDERGVVDAVDEDEEDEDERLSTVDW